MTQNGVYEYVPLYYGTPCQVRFVDCGDPNNITICGGIAYHDKIICGCCGAVLSIQDIIDDAKKAGIHWDDAIIELEWIDIEEAIRGGVISPSYWGVVQRSGPRSLKPMMSVRF